MRGRTNITSGKTAIVNANVEQFEAVEKIEAGSFVEPVYANVYKTDFFDNEDTSYRKIVRIKNTNYYLIVCYYGSSASKNLYFASIYEFDGNEFIRRSGNVEIGLSSIGNMILYKNNTFLVCGESYYAKNRFEIYKFNINMESIAVENVTKIYEIEGDNCTLGSSGIFFVDDRIIIVFFQNSLSKSGDRYYYWNAINKVTIEDIDNSESAILTTYKYNYGNSDKVPSSSITTKVSDLESDSVIMVDENNFITRLRSLVSTYNPGSGNTHEENYIYVSKITIDGENSEVKDLTSKRITMNNYASIKYYEFPVYLSKKYYLWICNEKIYKKDAVLQTDSSLRNQTDRPYIFYAGSYIEDCLSILIFYGSNGSTGDKYHYAIAVEYDDELNVVKISNKLNLNVDSYWCQSAAKISNNEILFLMRRGWLILRYENGVLSDGVATNKVKNYTKNSKVIGFAKTSGDVGDDIKVYVPQI